MQVVKLKRAVNITNIEEFTKEMNELMGIENEAYLETLPFEKLD